MISRHRSNSSMLKDIVIENEENHVMLNIFRIERKHPRQVMSSMVKLVNEIFSCLLSREMTVVLHRENVLQLSDDENEEEEDEHEDETGNNPDDGDDDNSIRNSTTVLTEIIDNKTDSNSINQQTSNDNPLPPSQPPPPAHVYENQM